MLWGLPRFSQYNRDLFFSLTAPELEILDRLRSHRTNAHFLLQLGYFVPDSVFFRFEMSTVRDDLEYLRRRFLDNEPVPEIAVSDHTRKHHVALILERFRHRLCGQQERLELEQRALAFERHRLSDALIELIAVDDTQLVDRLLKDDEGLHGAAQA